jgi:uncharacterized protein YwqG
MVDNALRKQICELIRQKSPRRLSAFIEQSIKESLVLRTGRRPDDQILIGKSKLGGMPDLPPDAVWPAWKDKHLSFIAQINLSNIPSLEFLDILPENGILSFFYSAEQETWGFDPNDKGSWRILHFEEQDLHRRFFPPDLPGMGIYKSCSLDLEVSFTLPALESPYIDLDYACEQWDEIDQYIDLMKSFEQLLDKGSCIHRLLGHPDQIQGDMLHEAQLASHGIYCGDTTSHQDPRRKDLEAGTINWELVLQIDSDDKSGMMWGDVGRIYFLMTAEHLKSRDFDATWMILQCA